MYCKYCKSELPDSRFQKAKKIGDKQYFRRKCTSCKNQEQNARLKSLREWFVEYKQTLSCKHCGNEDYRVMEFHHENPAEKDFNLADMLHGGFAIVNIQKELAKCICLCANCHRIEHYNY